MARDVDTTAQSAPKELLEPGSYQAVVYSIIDLGHQYSDKFNKWNRKIKVSFEIPSEIREFGEKKEKKPMTVHKKYTLSFAPKSALAIDLTSWKESGYDPKTQTFDLESILGKNCIVSVSIEQGTKSEFNKVVGLASLMKGQPLQKQINKTLIYRIEDGKSDVFNDLPDFLKEEILKSKEATEPEPDEVPATKVAAKAPTEPTEPDPEDEVN